MWWQSRGRSVLSTWVFGCAHGPVGKSSIWGIPEVHGQFSCLPGQTARCFPSALFLPTSLPFTFSPPSHYGLSSEKATDSSSFITCSQADSHSAPSPSISSARKVVLAHCQTSRHLLCCHHLCHHFPHSATSSTVQSSSHVFGVQMDESLRYPGMLCRSIIFFFSYGCLISCKPKGRDKRDDSHGHDADITPMIFLCIN